MVLSSIYLVSTAGVVAMMTAVWALSVRLRDASIIDAFWGLGFVLIAWIAFLHGPGTPPQMLLLGLVTVWGLRLAIYIGVRNHGKGEDHRYQAMRRARGDAFWWQSLFRIFYLQGALMLIIGVPLVVALGLERDPSWHWFDSLGTLLWLVGFGFEALGDAQLARFKRDPSSKGQVLDTGLWRYTRHPNYFGEAVLWFGYFAFALAVAGGFWTLPAPLLMLGLLLKVSGVALLEKDIAERRPAYRDYVQRTNAFVPWFPPRGGDAS